MKKLPAGTGSSLVVQYAITVPVPGTVGSLPAMPDFANSRNSRESKRRAGLQKRSEKMAATES